MLDNFIDISVSPLNLVIRSFVVYLFVIIILRIAGRRQIAQMGPTEFVAILLVSNSVQNSMNAGDNSLLGGIISALSLIVLSRVISWLTFKHKTMGRFFEGEPAVVISNGKVQKHILDRLLMSIEDLYAMLIAQQVTSLEAIKYGIIDVEGKLIIVYKENDLLKQMDKNTVYMDETNG